MPRRAGDTSQDTSPARGGKENHMPAAPWTARGAYRRKARAVATSTTTTQCLHRESPARRRAPFTPTTSKIEENEMASPDLAVQDVIETLDSFYCHNVVVGLWADAVTNRLEGMALYLLGDELREVADHARGAARRLADRIGDLGGAITADPRQLIDRAPGEGEFTIPECSDPRAIVTYALRRLNIIISAYQAFLDQVRARDDVSFALVVTLLDAETHRHADAQAALAAGPGAAAR
jgi:ferritin-like protein